MADVLVGSERRVLLGGYGLPAPPPVPPVAAHEGLLGRLDQIDLRLRQLEERRRAQAEESYFVADIRRAPAQQHHTKSLPSALQQVQLKGSLMDRLNLLETRIRQLSSELDGRDGSSAAAVTLAARPMEERAWSESALLEPQREAALCSADKPAAGSWSAVHILQRGARQLHRNKSNSKVKTLKDGSCACQSEKRKARTRRRWFPVGC